MTCATDPAFNVRLQDTGAYESIVHHFNVQHRAQQCEPTMCFFCSQLFEFPGMYCEHRAAEHTGSTAKTSSVHHSEKFIHVAAGGQMFTLSRDPERAPLYTKLDLASSQDEAQAWMIDLESADPDLGPLSEQSEILLSVLVERMKRWSLPNTHKELANLLESIYQSSTDIQCLAMLPPSSREASHWTVSLRSMEDVYLYASPDMERVDLTSLQSLFERQVAKKKRLHQRPSHRPFRSTRTSAQARCCCPCKV